MSTFKRLCVCTFKQVPTVMVATVHIAAATQTIPSYSPCGAIVHSHLAHDFLGPHELVGPPNVFSVGLAIFGLLPVFPSEDTRTTEHATLFC